MSSTSQSDTSLTRRFNRRTFLGLAWLTMLAILGACLAGIGMKFVIPRREGGEYGGIFEVGPVRDLPEPGETPVKYAKGRFWLVPTEHGLLALSNVCTHLDCLIDWDQSSGRFVCPCHGSQFAVDGQYRLGPAPRSLDRFVVQLVDAEGTIISETNPQTGDPLSVGHNSGSEDTTSAEQETAAADTDNDAYADLIVWVDTGRKITGPAGGGALSRT